MLNSEKLNTATDFYLNEDYHTAAAMFDELSTEQTSNPFLLINSANSNFHTKHYGKAIKKYIKAKQILPRNKELNHNLKVLMNEIKLQQPPLLGFNYMNFSEALIVVLIFNILFLMRNKIFTNKLLKFFMGICFVLTAINFAFIASEHKVKNYAVVTSISSSAYSGDNDAYTELFELLDGQIVELVKENESWSQIKHQNSLGWIKNADIELI